MGCSAIDCGVCSEQITEQVHVDPSPLFTLPACRRCMDFWKRFSALSNLQFSISSQYLLLFLMSLSCRVLLPTFISAICPSITSWRRQFILSMFSIRFAILSKILFGSVLISTVCSRISSLINFSHLFIYLFIMRLYIGLSSCVFPVRGLLEKYPTFGREQSKVAGSHIRRVIMVFMKSGSLFMESSMSSSPGCTGTTRNMSFSLQWKSD